MAGRKKVLITGAAGRLGRIATAALSEQCELTLVDVLACPDESGFRRLDLARDGADFCRLAAGHEVIIHLAYVEETEDTAANMLMVKTVFRAALASRPRPRVVLASSTHAVGGHYDWGQEPYRAIAAGSAGAAELAAAQITIEHCLWPNSVYGACKGYMELLGRFYADRGVQVLAVRFGGVREDDQFEPEAGYRSFWLSRRDCERLFQEAVEAEISAGFSVVFAVSANRWRIHDLEPARQLLGWEPEDAAERIEIEGEGVDDRVRKGRNQKEPR